MVGLIYAVRRRLRRPPFIGWGGDYSGDLLFTPLWNPDPRGEIR